MRNSAFTHFFGTKSEVPSEIYPPLTTGNSVALNWSVSDFKWIDGYKYNEAWPNGLETKSMKTIVEYMTYLYEISGSTIHMEVSYLTYNTRTYLWKKK